MHEKRHFLSYWKHCHDTQIMWPYAYYVTLGSHCKMANLSPKTKLIHCPRDPQGYSRISLSLSGRILKEYRNIVSASKQTHAVFCAVCEIALTEVLATQMGVMLLSKKVSSFELYKFNPLSPHCGSIVQELVHCYTWGCLRIVTVCSKTVGRHS